VSAASILAKVERDAVLDRIKTLCSDIGAPSPGSGYTSDAVTVAFLEAVVPLCKDASSQAFASLLPHIRTSWATFKRFP
jgi:ribonuclease HII